MDWLFETMDLRMGKDEMATIRPVVSTGEGASSVLMGRARPGRTRSANTAGRNPVVIRLELLKPGNDEPCYNPL